MNKAYNRDIMAWKKFPNYDIIWCDTTWEPHRFKKLKEALWVEQQ